MKKVLQKFGAFLLIPTACLLFPAFDPPEADAQVFGKNKVQYKDFHWQKTETPHFDIYYYQGEEDLARFASTVIEEANDALKEDFNHTLSQRIPVLIYNSHNDFQQTNVILELIDEYTGGFTEVYKNRVVVPFQGSYEDFRHVLHHELTHAFEFDLLYGGGGIGSLLTRSTVIQLPLWLMEGMAEFTSQGTRGDVEMVMQDVVIHEGLLSIRELNFVGDYRAYKQGQSLLNFISERYGRKKVGEIFHQARALGGIEKAFKKTLRISLSELTEQWHNSLKRKYWPLFAEKKELNEVARQLTYHRKEKSFFNVSPAISPDGEKIAYLSDRNNYSDLYIISSIDGRRLKHLVKGERSGGFESLHMTRAGITWSPDGSKLAFSAKGGALDRLYIVDALDGDVEKRFDFDLDGLYTPSWSPDGEEIVFVGLKDGSSDLYLLTIATGDLTRLTQDRFDDRDPSWAPEGQRITFVSDRPLPEDTLWHYGQYAVYLMDVGATAPPESGRLPEPLTSRHSGRLASPRFSPDGEKILYTLDNNLYFTELETRKNTQLTNLIGRIFSLSLSDDGERLAIAGYEEGGWDIYMIKGPMDLPMVEKVQSEKKEEEIDYTVSIQDTLSLNSKKVGFHLSPDWAAGGFSYSTTFGFSGQSQVAFSDILGNHRFYLGTDFYSSNILDSNILLLYWYLPKRIDYGLALYQQKDYYLLGAGINEVLVAERKIYGGVGLIQYPFDRFHRLDFQFEVYSIRDIQALLRNDFGNNWEIVYQDTLGALVLFPSLAFTKDTSLWGSTGPVNGSRHRLSIGKTFMGSGFSFTTAVADLRKYVGVGKRSTFATRLVGGSSWGEDRIQGNFYLGGSQNLRGFDDYEFIGSNVGLLNLEYRYPLIDRMKIAFPLLMEFRGIRGVLFTDLGAVTDRVGDFRVSSSSDRGLLGFELDDLKASFGFGTRMRFSFFVLKLDFAWATTGWTQSTTSKMRTHFSLGTDF
ncbi:PD40 domain-containing protein [candidate division TA06 bacterium]|nr:PD40 domain-containing protein [candidate division TA06 bacterium]